MFLMATMATIGNFIIAFLYWSRPVLKKNANLLIANIAVAGKKFKAAGFLPHNFIIANFTKNVSLVNIVLSLDFRHVCWIREHDSSGYLHELQHVGIWSGTVHHVRFSGQRHARHQHVPHYDDQH